MMSKNRLWRVNISHVRGYYAPYILVVTSDHLKYKAEAEALKLAKERSRLSDFDCWTFEAICLERKYFNGKWVTPEEFESLIEKLGSFNKRKEVIDE